LDAASQSPSVATIYGVAMGQSHLPPGRGQAQISPPREQMIKEMMLEGVISILEA